ncbi:restriction endonuclease subunit S [Brachybacterium sp. AOP43-C2-M15]|uniref:restriction endonuclease subunit S n=1 Tax=Brachybacterium sp. AOP43-C2-M15 TaxID=3457661 RepID=UPI0040337FDD
MSRIDDLIQELCPDGVAGRPLGSLGTRNKGTAMTASKMKTIGGGGPIRVFAGGQTVADVAEDAIPAKDIVRVPSIIVKSRGHIGFSYYERPFTHKTELWSYTIDAPGVDQKFVYYYLLTQVEKLQVLARATSVKLPQLSVRDTDTLNVPVPPFEVQREIVRVLDKFTQLEAELEAELEARRAQYEHYRAEFLTFRGEVPRRRLDEVAVYVNGKAHEKLVVDGAEIPLVTARFISRNGEANRYVPLEDVLTPGRSGDVALVLSDLPNGRALARTFFVDRDDSYAINQRVARITVKDTAEMNPKFLHFVLDRNRGLLKHDNGVDQTHLSKGQVTGLEIPVPSIEEQDLIVEHLERFDALVNDISIGLPAELTARRKQYEHYRDRLLTFKELKA